MPEEAEQAEEFFGDPIPEVFPPDEPAARFVVAMAMAGNDIDRAFHDLLRSHKENRADFTYRVRLVTGHLVEAIDALSQYSKCEDVRRLLARVPASAQRDLTKIRGTLQQAGPQALAAIRDNTFHYPSPDPAYNPTSDAKLRDVIAGMTKVGTEMHYDSDTNELTLSFADEIALHLAMGGTGVTAEEIIRRSEVARDGALAFHRWSKALVNAYMDSKGHHFGKPRIIENPKPAEPG